ncbi:hypothetical protein A2U01_0112405, partial [Trifolium medium]|nr:hypothetical protein [Trifolium medium]
NCRSMAKKSEAETAPSLTATRSWNKSPRQSRSAKDQENQPTSNTGRESAPTLTGLETEVVWRHHHLP